MDNKNSHVKQRDLHKAFLRYHDPANWPLLRDALTRMGREELIGSGPNALVPAASKGKPESGRPAHKKSFHQKGKRQPRRRTK